MMIRTIDWQVNSGSLNPINNICAVLKERIQMESPNDTKVFEKQIEVEWQKFKPIFLANYIKKNRLFNYELFTKCSNRL